MLELISLHKDCEAGRNTLLAYYPKYPLMCEICAVAICDSGCSETCTFPLDCISKIVPIACIEHGTHFIRVNAINSEIRILVIMARMQYYWNDSIGGASVDICDYGLSFP